MRPKYIAVTLLAVMTFVITGYGQSNPPGDTPKDHPTQALQERLLGRWTGESPDGDLFEIEFLKGGKGTFSDQGLSGGALPMRYSTNCDKVPHELDLVLDGYTGFTIFEFTPDGRLRMAAPSERRSKDYRGRNMMVLQKSDDNSPVQGTEAWAEMKLKEMEELAEQMAGQPGIASTEDWRGEMLHNAVRSGRFQMAKLLLKKGANPNAKDGSNRTPLCWAAVASQLEMATMLLELGADPNVADRQGNTPLHGASQKGHLSIVELLLKKGVKNPNATNKNGETPLQLAANAQKQEVVEFLKRNRAKE